MRIPSPRTGVFTPRAAALNAAVLLGLGAAPASALAGPKILAPRDGGVVLGDALDVEVDDADRAPDCRLDGAPVTPTWTALPYADRWVARLAVPAPGPHTVEVTLRSGSARARFESTGGGSVAIGDRVARHLLATKNLPGLAWNWGPAVLTYGLHELSGPSPDGPRYKAALRDYYAGHAGKLPRIDRPDRCAAALGALALERTDGITVGHPSARTVADYLAHEPRNALGAIDHLGARSLPRWLSNASLLFRPWAHSIWVDSLMMYAVFAAQWGNAEHDPALLDFGAAQPAIFARELQDPATGLFTHAWDLEHHRRLGARWLRGNGWVGTSIVEILDELPAGHPRRPELTAILQDLARGLMQQQLADGLWDSVVDHPGASYTEASGSALVAYALAKGARRGYLRPEALARARHAFEALTERLRPRAQGGLSVTGISIETNAQPAWLYPLVPRRDDVDYGVGAYLLLAAELQHESW